jgi:hypothetical protein
VIDPFSGSGVVPLESLLLDRAVIANDVSPYAAALTRAKLHVPTNEILALATASNYVSRAKLLARGRNYRIDAPRWVRSFFHPKTLAETKLLAELLLRGRQWFLLANLLGILHHQRPGFLSYPSSHLVPYLRVRKFPRHQFPGLYRYRDVEPRLVRKISRSYRRFSGFESDLKRVFSRESIFNLTPSYDADVAITSPPYMNALDYGRDNRLRLWFLGINEYRSLDQLVPRNPLQFSKLLDCLAHLLRRTIRGRGRAILVLGEVSGRHSSINTAQIAKSSFERAVGGWRLCDQIVDFVPDVRRSRRGCRGTKREWIMVFKKTTERRAL